MVLETCNPQLSESVKQHFLLSKLSEPKYFKSRTEQFYFLITQKKCALNFQENCFLLEVKLGNSNAPKCFFYWES